MHMSKGPSSTLAAKISEDTKARLQELAAKALQTKQKQSVKNTEKITASQDKTQNNKHNTTSNKDNKKIAKPDKVQKINTQSPNKPQPKKFAFSKEDYYAILKYMQEHYPKCFTTPPSPLAIGIHNLLFAIEDMPFSKTKTRRFFASYTRTKKYLSSLVVGNDRIGLDGMPTSKVIAEEVKNIKHKGINNNKTPKQPGEQQKLEQSANSTTNDNKGVV